MHDLVINKNNEKEKFFHIHIKNCDKDGAIVSARLASLLNAVSSLRPLKINPDRYTDHNYFNDIGNKLAKYYSLVKKNKLFSTETIVLSSVHRAALYIAEVLHAPILPMQIISFSRSIKEAQQTSLFSIVGTDYDYKGLWQWNKITHISHFPTEYVKLINRAKHLIIVRSIDEGKDCPIEGKIKDLFINCSIKKLNPLLWKEIKDLIVEKEKDYGWVRQWEWGLPDNSIKAVKDLWKSLKKDITNLHIIEANSIDLYKFIPFIWEKYLNENKVSIRGITLNSYWTAHPYYERYAGLIPIHFYKFSYLQKIAVSYIRKFCLKERSPETLCAFINNIGDINDINNVKLLLNKIGVEKESWVSNGIDSPDAIAKDIYNNEIPKPFEKISEWIKKAPYKDKIWKALNIKKLLNFFNDLKKNKNF